MGKGKERKVLVEELEAAALLERRRAARAESARRRFVRTPSLEAEAEDEPVNATLSEPDGDEYLAGEQATWQAFKARRQAHKMPEFEEAPEREEAEEAPPPAGKTHSLVWALGIFGLSPEDLSLGSFGLDDLQRLYRLKSRLFHPDRVDQNNPAALAYAQSRMSDLNEARELLLSAINQE